jgi:hypothetical protein
MRTRLEKFGATLGITMAVAGGIAGVEAYEKISNVKQYCHAHHLGKAACQNEDNLPPAMASEQNTANTLGMGGALGIGLGAMLAAVALSKATEANKELRIVGQDGQEFIIADSSALAIQEGINLRQPARESVTAVAGD